MIQIASQLQLEIDLPKPTDSQWGTFKDSLRAPIHSWFTYPAGFSYRAVEHSLSMEALEQGASTIYDPFMGSGTTNLVAKSLGYNSVGVEAHPFVFEITQAKLHWSLRRGPVLKFVETLKDLSSNLPTEKAMTESNVASFPELVTKCFLPETLYVLHRVRDAIEESSDIDRSAKRFLNTALICTLRKVSSAATGWPYIAPSKTKVTSLSKEPLPTYISQVHSMLEDLEIASAEAEPVKSNHKLILGSSAKTKILDESIDHIFTSPPYLNNFDYADRTRLEMYFMGAAESWSDISSQVRVKLMTSATTQISRTDPKYSLDVGIQEVAPDTYAFLSEAVESLGELRKTKGGKKSYDLMVSGYFNDIFQILKDNFRTLKAGATARYILGDSAPYGVHVPTDQLIGDLGCAIGFKSFEIEVLRERGGKWADNPQRHNVPLRESIVTLVK